MSQDGESESNKAAQSEGQRGGSLEEELGKLVGLPEDELAALAEIGEADRNSRLGKRWRSFNTWGGLKEAGYPDEQIVEIRKIWFMELIDKREKERKERDRRPKEAAVDDLRTDHPRWNWIVDEDWSGIKVAGASQRAGFQRVKFVNGRFAEDCAFTDSSFEECDFRNADLTGMKFTNTEFYDCNFQQADLTGARFDNSRISECDFRRAVLAETNIFESKLSSNDFRNADLRGAWFHGIHRYSSEISFCEFNGGNLAGVVFDWIPEGGLVHCDFTDVDLTETLFSAKPQNPPRRWESLRRENEGLPEFGSTTLRNFLYERTSKKTSVSKSLRYSVLERDKRTCLSCGRSRQNYPELELHVDHIVPESKGGTTRIDNLQTLCRDCNLGKGNRYDTDLR